MKQQRLFILIGAAAAATVGWCGLAVAQTGQGLEPLMATHDEAVDREDAASDGKLKRKKYEKTLRKLQGELCKLQAWVKHKGLRVIVVFEGRDAAGKGGTIRAITERLSPRVFRVVALPAPTDRQKTELYMQRYITHFPAAGEIVIFDRSWYNRAGVEYVMAMLAGADIPRQDR